MMLLVFITISALIACAFIVGQALGYERGTNEVKAKLIEELADELPPVEKYMRKRAYEER
jgi:predicted outer membrane lipoprotein